MSTHPPVGIKADSVLSLGGSTRTVKMDSEDEWISEDGSAKMDG
jgi:hypothetical protein